MVLGWVLLAGHIPLAASHTCLLRHQTWMNLLEMSVARSIPHRIIDSRMDCNSTPHKRQLLIMAGLGDGTPVSVETSGGSVASFHDSRCIEI